MKPPKGSIVGYTPGPVPSNPVDIPRYLDEEFNRIAGVLMGLLANPASLRLAPMAAPPSMPAAGMIVYTDGTQWDPGSGEGYYYFNTNGVWTPLG